MTARMSSASAGRMRDADFGAIPGRTDQFPELPNEKRSSTRFAFEEPIILETDRGEMIGAVVINYGRCGLYFESNFESPRGTVLIIRNESALSTPCHGGCAARVRWSREIKRLDGDYCFGTGVQYC